MKNKQNIIIILSVIFLVIISYFFIFKIQNTENKTENGSLENINLNKPEEVATSSTSTNINTKITKNNNSNSMQEKYTIEMKTNKGLIVLELDKTIAPKTVENFVKLSNDKFYDGVKFHRIIKGFMIQGGDPLSKDESQKAFWGTGGPGYKFADEVLDEDGKVKSIYQNGYKRGVIAMANAGPNTNGSQFFIMHADYPLPPSYTIFGKVISGIETVDLIANSTKDQSDKPLESIIIQSIIVK